jgi:hypothetical protein
MTSPAMEYIQLKAEIEKLMKAIDAIRVLACGRATLAESNILQICNSVRRGEDWSV